MIVYFGTIAISLDESNGITTSVEYGTVLQRQVNEVKEKEGTKRYGSTVARGVLSGAW
jgi:hypothetical protein